MNFVHLSMTPTELQNMISSKERMNYSMIDLRERRLYNQFHLEGAINIDYDTFMQQDSYEAILKNKTAVILYCERGGSSIYAAKRLTDYCRKHGKEHRIYSLSGGMAGYQRKFGSSSRSIGIY